MFDQARGMLKKEIWEIKTLGEIAADVYRGSEVTKAQLGTGDYPAVKCGDVNSGLPMQFTECINFINPSLIKNKKYFEHGDILIGTLAHNVDAIGKAIIYLGSNKCIVGNDVTVLKTEQNNKFLTYMLSSKYCRKQIKRMAQDGAVVHLHMKELMKIKIPLPPRHIQDLIVGYLDTWTELEKELEKELDGRKKQYRHYKELLLSSEIDKWDR